MPVVNLTARKVHSLRATEARQIDYWDSTLKNFGLRISANGRKTWSIYYRFHGRKRRLSLGTYPAVSLANARFRARNLLSRVANGDDPAAENILTRNAGTFAELATAYLDRHAKPKKKSWKSDEWVINRHLLPKWRQVKARDVSQADVQSLVDTIGATAPILANRVLALISKMFNFSIKKKWRLDNPCQWIDKPGIERSRDRVLSHDEIRAVWNSLASETPFLAALFKLRLLTAARGGEIRKMRWADVDLKTRWWTIPYEDSKNSIQHRVPLNEAACELVEELRTWQVDRLNTINRGRLKKGWQIKQFSEWVFPSPRGDSPFAWEQRATKRIRTTSGVDFRPHDLRRTVATMLTEHGYADRFILKRILNHMDTDVTAVYDRSLYDTQKRNALESWGRRLLTILEEKDHSNIIPMSSGRN
jgi:integrase